MSEMGTFRIAVEALGIDRFSRWRFRQANGMVVERWVGPAFIYAAGKRAADEVVFGEPGDLVLIGARSLEGLNLRIEPATKQLVDAGPAPAALATTHSPLPTTHYLFSQYATFTRNVLSGCKSNRFR
jgi:hypothetical protein